MQDGKRARFSVWAKACGKRAREYTRRRRRDSDLKKGVSEVTAYHELDLPLVTRAFYKQTLNTRLIPLTFAPEEPNAESMEAIADESHRRCSLTEC